MPSPDFLLLFSGFGFFLFFSSPSKLNILSHCLALASQELFYLVQTVFKIVAVFLPKPLKCWDFLPGATMTANFSRVHGVLV